MKCLNCGHSIVNHGTVGNSKGKCLVPICSCEKVKKMKFELTIKQYESIQEMLTEIKNKLGPYSQYQLTHAENVIESNSKYATLILELLKTTTKEE